MRGSPVKTDPTKNLCKYCGTFTVLPKNSLCTNAQHEYNKKLKGGSTNEKKEA